MRRQKYAADEGEGNNTPDQTNEEEIGSLPKKRIQSNDSKDDPKSWK